MSYYDNDKEITVAMKTPVFINNVETRAIIDTGAASCAITHQLLLESGYEIERSSNIQCVMANGERTASMGKSMIIIEIEGLTTEIEVEVINSQNRTLIIGNDFLKEWKANIDFESHTLTLSDDNGEMIIPVTYVKSNKVRFEETPQDEDTDDEDPIYERDEEVETFNINDLEEIYISEDEELK